MVPAIYALYLIGWLVIPIIIGVILAHLLALTSKGWLHSHYRWQIRTFWYYMLWSVLALLASIFVGLFLMALDMETQSEFIVPFGLEGMPEEPELQEFISKVPAGAWILFGLIFLPHIILYIWFIYRCIRGLKLWLKQRHTPLKTLVKSL